MKIRNVIILIAAVSLAVYLFYAFGKKGRNDEAEEAVRRDIGYTVSATGKVEGSKEADIGVESPGRIRFVAEEGKRVKKGDMVLSLEEGDLPERLGGAEKTLWQAGADFEKYSGLYEKGYASKRELELAETSLLTAKADVDAIKKLIEDRSARAPFDGVVVKKYKDVGETAGMAISYEPVLKMADIEKLRVRAEVEESDIWKVKKGQTADVTADAYPGEVFRGRVVRVGYAAGRKKLKGNDPKELVDVKVVEAEIELPGDERLKVGLTVEVKTHYVLKENALSVPIKSVFSEGGESLVWAFEGKKPERRKVLTGEGDDYFIEIIEGLKEGERVLKYPPSGNRRRRR